MSLSHRNMVYNPNGQELLVTSVTALAGIFENSNTINQDFIIESGNNAISAGPITIANGKKVTVSDGSRWVIE